MNFLHSSAIVAPPMPVYSHPIVSNYQSVPLYSTSSMPITTSAPLSLPSVTYVQASSSGSTPPSALMSFLNNPPLPAGWVLSSLKVTSSVSPEAIDYNYVVEFSPAKKPEAGKPAPPSTLPLPFEEPRVPANFELVEGTHTISTVKDAGKEKQTCTYVLKYKISK